MFSTSHILLLSVFVAFVAAGEDMYNATAKYIDKPLTLAFKPKTRRRSHTTHNDTDRLPELDGKPIVDESMASVIHNAIHSSIETITVNNTALDPLKFVLSELSLPKRRASDMVCDVTWDKKKKKKLMRCTEVDPKTIYFEDNECDSKTDVCTRLL